MYRLLDVDPDVMVGIPLGPFNALVALPVPLDHHVLGFVGIFAPACHVEVVPFRRPSLEGSYRHVLGYVILAGGPVIMLPPIEAAQWPVPDD